MPGPALDWPANVGGARIIVTDAQDRQGLAAVRCLGDAGHRVTGVATTRLAPGLWSRSCETRRILPEARLGVDRFIARLAELVRSDPHDVLLCGTDETVLAVSRWREQIEPHVRLGLPAHAVVERAFSKELLATESARFGLASPEGRPCESSEEALAAAAAFGYPVLVKPAQTIVEAENRLIRHPSRLAEDEAALVDIQRRVGRCIVQRRVPGTVISFGGVVVDDRLLCSVVSRYRRTYPPMAGGASSSVTIAASPDLSERVEALVAAIGWQGLFELELIELEDGTMGAIDFNPRLYGSMALAPAAGVPLATRWCEWLMGAQPAPASARAGVSYKLEDADLRYTLWQLRNGDYRGAASALVPRHDTTHAYFRVRDPVPLLVHGAELARVRWRHAREPDAGRA